MSQGTNEAMHRMSGTQICWRFQWPRLPLIGDLGRYAKTGSIRIMKQTMAVLAAASSMLLAGCCTMHHTGRWEYKVTEVPQSAEEAKNMRAPSYETRQNYLNSLGRDGWMLVTEDQGVLYLRRPAH